MTSADSTSTIPQDWKPTLKAGVQSVIGNYREHNEDSYYIPGFAPVSRYHANVASSGSYDPTVEVKPPEGPKDLFVVADGMGGQLAGEQASQMAVDIVPQQIQNKIKAAENTERKTIRAILRDSLAKANEEIRNMAGVGPDFINMGTTCVVAYFDLDAYRAYVTGIGDSRAYHVRAGKIEQLTKDHSLAQALADAGTIKQEEVLNHKFSHVLYLYLGSPDARDGPDTIREIDLRPGDRFLLASDGLTGVVPDSILAQKVSESVDPQATSEALVKLALEKGSKDNVTCAIIFVD